MVVNKIDIPCCKFHFEDLKTKQGQKLIYMKTVVPDGKCDAKSESA